MYVFYWCLDPSFCLCEQGPAAASALRRLSELPANVEAEVQQNKDPSL